MVFLYKIPSSNNEISYNLVSLINHDGDSLNCGHYVSDIFDANTGIWWQCHDDYITQIGDPPKGVNIRESHKKEIEKNVMSGSTYISFLFISEQSI